MADVIKKVTKKAKVVKKCGECKDSPCVCCKSCHMKDCLCVKLAKELKPEPVKEVVKKCELKELFVPISKHTEAMEILGVGCLVRSKGELVFIPGVKILLVGKDVHILTKA